MSVCDGGMNNKLMIRRAARSKGQCWSQFGWQAKYFQFRFTAFRISLHQRIVCACRWACGDVLRIQPVAVRSLRVSQRAEAPSSITGVVLSTISVYRTMISTADSSPLLAVITPPL